MTYEEDIIHVHEIIKIYNNKFDKPISSPGLRSSLVSQLNYSNKKSDNLINALVSSGKVRKVFIVNCICLWSNEL